MNDEGSPTWRLLSEQLEAAKGEIARLKALRNEGELNEKLKDPGYAAKVALAGLISERDALLLQNRELQNRVDLLKMSLESILKRELGLDFQTYLDSKAAMPLTRVLIDEVIEKLSDKPVCSVCKEPIGDGFALRKAAWCEKCGGYSHGNCWAAHNLTYCLKRKEETVAFSGCGHVLKAKDALCPICGV